METSFSRILPNGNGMSRKRFEFGNPEALEGFLADLSEYEEKKNITQRRLCLYKDQFAVLVSTYARRTRRSNTRSDADAKVEDKDEMTQVVTTRDIRLAPTLEELFEVL